MSRPKPYIATVAATTSYAGLAPARTIVSATIAPSASGGDVVIQSTDGNDDDITLPAAGAFFHRIDLADLLVKRALDGTAASVDILGFIITD